MQILHIVSNVIYAKSDTNTFVDISYHSNQSVSKKKRKKERSCTTTEISTKKGDVTQNWHHTITAPPFSWAEFVLRNVQYCSWYYYMKHYSMLHPLLAHPLFKHYMMNIYKRTANPGRTQPNYYPVNIQKKVYLFIYLFFVSLA